MSASNSPPSARGRSWPSTRPGTNASSTSRSPSFSTKVRAHLAAGNAPADLPEEVRFLGGLTQIRYVLVYPQEKDLVIAGPAEPWHVAQGGPGLMTHVVGKRSGRPVMQLDDLVVAMRTMSRPNAGQFGCGIWPQPDSGAKASAVALEHARSPRAARMAALHDALGPQEVKFFGVGPDTRAAFVCVAADYQLKRIALGLHNVPGANVGHAIDNSRSAANMVWFKLAYEPLLVSPEADAYALRGPRLQVGAGQFDFDPRGATDKAKQFCKKFSEKMADMAIGEPLIAELQNIADLGMAAALIRSDGLDKKVGWDAGWLLSDSGYPVATLPVPKTADTCVSSVGGSLCCGGVVLTPGGFLGPAGRVTDDKAALAGPKKSAADLRRAAARSAAMLHETPVPAARATAATKPAAAPLGR